MTSLDNTEVRENVLRMEWKLDSRFHNFLCLVFHLKSVMDTTNWSHCTLPQNWLPTPSDWWKGRVQSKNLTSLMVWSGSKWTRPYSRKEVLRLLSGSPAAMKLQFRKFRVRPLTASWRLWRWWASWNSATSWAGWRRRRRCPVSPWVDWQGDLLLWPPTTS